MQSPNSRTRGWDTRAAILDAAADCFAENGYTETGVAEICRRAGVSRGALYYHFESKQAIFLELVDSQLADLKEALEMSARDAVSIPASLRRLSYLMPDLIRSDYTRASIFLEVWSQASREQTVRETLLETYRHFEDIFTRLIRRGIEEGTFAAIDPTAGAQALLAVSSGTFIRSLLDPGGTDWGKNAGKSINILIEGLKRRSTK